MRDEHGGDPLVLLLEDAVELPALPLDVLVVPPVPVLPGDELAVVAPPPVDELPPLPVAPPLPWMSYV